MVGRHALHLFVVKLQALWYVLGFKGWRAEKPFCPVLLACSFFSLSAHREAFREYMGTPCEQSLNAGTPLRSCPALTSSGLHFFPALCTCPHQPGLGCWGSIRSCRLGSRAAQPVWGLWLNLTFSLARLRRKGTGWILFPGSTPGRWKGFQPWPTTKHTVLIIKLTLHVSQDLDQALLPENLWK